MSPEFRMLIEPLHEKFERLRDMAPWKGTTTLPKQGVYLFSENCEHLYIGRSYNILRRYKDHTRGGPEKSAFARILACKRLSRERNYAPGAKERAKDPEFVAACRSAKERIREMEFRAVEECDQTSQALLEIYCAVTLGTCHNDFGTS